MNSPAIRESGGTNASLVSPLALDPYSPRVPVPDGTAAAADPLGLDPYSPIVGHARRPERDGGERTR
jgi:hypothetical protein